MQTQRQQYVSLLNKYLSTKYVSSGREYPNLDCWGLVRLAKFDLFGGELLPECQFAKPGFTRDITKACGDVTSAFGLTECEPKTGAIATAWRGILCVHVGLVVEADGQQWVLETDEPTGPCLTRPSMFERKYSKVIYYAD